MRVRRFLLLCAVASVAGGCGPAGPEVELETQFGTIRIVVDTLNAPRTAANFLRYVDKGRYDQASFYRVRRAEAELMQRPGAILQGGLFAGDTTKMLPPIPLESTRKTGLKHVDGAVSLARFGENTGRAEFFIVSGDQPHLDYRDAQNPGYAVFGYVSEGMDLVRRIQKLPAGGERLARPIPFRARRAK